MLIVTEKNELKGCVEDYTSYCKTCVWNRPHIVNAYGECHKIQVHRTISTFNSSYLRTCSCCGEVYGCRVVGQNFSIERICSGCPDYFKCKLPDTLNHKEEGQCLQCSNKDFYEDDD